MFLNRNLWSFCFSHFLSCRFVFLPHLFTGILLLFLSVYMNYLFVKDLNILLWILRRSFPTDYLLFKFFMVLEKKCNAFHLFLFFYFLLFRAIFFLGCIQVTSSPRWPGAILLSCLLSGCIMDYPSLTWSYVWRKNEKPWQIPNNSLSLSPSFFFFFCLFRAVPLAYGSSQGRGE